MSTLQKESPDISTLQNIFGDLMNAAQGFYDESLRIATTLFQKIELLRPTPFYPAFEFCLSHILDSHIQALWDNTAHIDSEEMQEALMSLMATALMLQKEDILHRHVGLIRWTSWHPLNCRDADFDEVHQKLIERFPDLAVRFPKPSE